ncbi:MAG TPA: DM13 domain-containing protein [Acidimicrobiia bacterium]|nr:DM13 domain-containing protein [Acidimicrobiia bacterium]
MRTSSIAPGRRSLRAEYIPEAVLLVALTVFFVHQNDAATSAFKSSKAVAIMGSATLGWLGARMLLGRRVRSAMARTAAFTVAAVVALSVVVLPAYDTETVVEPFPVAEAAAMPAAAPASSSAPFTATRPAPAGPQRRRTGTFRGIDHRASGTVAVYRQPDGRYVVGLEDINIQPGPDYDVYIVPGKDREDTEGGVRLDDLRGNRGTQFYEVHDGVRLESGPWTVLIWCQTFAVPVAGATPA